MRQFSISSFVHNLNLTKFDPSNVLLSALANGLAGLLDLVGLAAKSLLQAVRIMPHVLLSILVIWAVVDASSFVDAVNTYRSITADQKLDTQSVKHATHTLLVLLMMTWCGAIYYNLIQPSRGAKAFW
jgi:purine-cytosine permease-like protein